MPRKNKRQAFLKALSNSIDFGKSLNNMRKNGITKDGVMQAAGRGYAAGSNIRTLVKQRKGGVIMKGGKYVYVSDGKPPYKHQVAMMNRRNKNYRSGKTGRGKNMTQPMGQGKAQALAYTMARRPNANVDSTNLSRTVISHYENISSLQGNNGGISNPLIYSYSINPGQATLFSWGAPVMANWTKYTPMAVVIQLTSTCASTTTGSWSAAFDYAPTRNVNSVDSLNVMRTMHNCYGDVKDHLTLVYYIPRILQTRKLFSVRTGLVPSGQDVNEYDLGHLYVGVESNTTDVIGYVSISYSFSMSEPNSRVPAQGCFYICKSTTPTYSYNFMPYGTQYSANCVVIFAFTQGAPTFYIKFIVPYEGYFEIYFSYNGNQPDYADMDGQDTINWPWLLEPYQTTATTLCYPNQTFYESQNYEQGYLQTWVKSYAGDIFVVNPINAWNLPIYYNIEVALTLSTVNPNVFSNYSDPALTFADDVKPISRVTKNANHRVEVVKTEATVLPQSRVDEKYPEEVFLQTKASSTPPILIENTLTPTKPVLNRRLQTFTSRHMSAKFEAEQGPSYSIFLVFTVLIYAIVSQIVPPSTKHPTSVTTRRPTYVQHTRPPTSYPTLSYYTYTSDYVQVPMNSTCVFGIPNSMTTNALFESHNCTTFKLNFHGLWSGIILFEFQGIAATSLPLLTFGTPVYRHFTYGSCAKTYMIQSNIVYNVTSQHLFTYTSKGFTVTGTKFLYVYLLPLTFSEYYKVSFYPDGPNTGIASTQQLPQCTSGTCNTTPAPTPAPVSDEHTQLSHKPYKT